DRFFVLDIVDPAEVRPPLVMLDSAQRLSDADGLDQRPARELHLVPGPDPALLMPEHLEQVFVGLHLVLDCLDALHRARLARADDEAVAKLAQRAAQRYRFLAGGGFCRVAEG